jgi:type I restriction enzyme M protein
LVDARESFVKMRKSLGDKRKEISSEQIDDITCLYGEFTENERVKIFPNASFGYQRITVERTLRLRWSVSTETLELLSQEKAWAKLSEAEKADLTMKLAALVGFDTTKRSDLAKQLGSVRKAIEKSLWELLAARDEEAPIVKTRKGKPEPDPDLRDNENVPLPIEQVTWAVDPTERLGSPSYRSTVDNYMEAEVLPFVPDAWVDHDKTKIGYEIPLTRHFYKYVPPRPLDEIDAEIRTLEAEIQELLKDVTE